MLSAWRAGSTPPVTVTVQPNRTIVLRADDALGGARRERPDVAELKQRALERLARHHAAQVGVLLRVRVALLALAVEPAARAVAPRVAQTLDSRERARGRLVEEPNNSRARR